ncbi:hypothetical protein PTSG_02464 [Salpingoeca rosetta]|uniref:PPM-type phosphatase domain-containing protein n=1 Tax=Salpingoeca rosetta (strain ATCC 50818 / BSB-021) TaxID=946362 RepID=F2U2A0_SALR5|nr:uncharacterized protein PTSG_02464 [Salpingoeca rosetta]EGD81752.1 hypothetical protein PTSG_02464 [Salpingoeca rosetta]|eukprot:XP_004996956.1 hypothetical protein PTSG_02464 [Salpingoeca rosetta]
MEWMKAVLRKGPSPTSDTPPAPTEDELVQDEEGYPVILSTEREFLASQGLMIGQNGAALYHGTTSPPKYYDFLYKLPTGINMDRGGFGHARDGTNFGAVFDGVTAGGRVNAYAAQAFAEYALRWLAVHKHRLHQIEGERLHQEVHNLFRQCIAKENNPGGNMQAEGGSATGVIASCHRTQRGRLMLVGATIGDASAIVVDPDGGCRIVSRYQRSCASAKDTGGQLTMCMGVHGDINTFSEPLTEQSIVILTTDGFTDNILQSDFSNIIDVILRAPYFDDDPAMRTSVDSDLSRLPDLRELRQLVGRLESLDSVPCRSMVVRVSNYLKWVTRALHAREQDFYALQIEMRDTTEALLQKQAELKRRKAARLEQDGADAGAGTGAADNADGAGDCTGDGGADQRMNGERINGHAGGDGGDGGDGGGEIAAEEAEVQRMQEKIKSLEVDCARLRQQQKRHRVAGKTDDALIVALRPVWL